MRIIDSKSSGPRSVLASTLRRTRTLPLAVTASVLAMAGTAAAAPGVPSNGRVSFGEFFSQTNDVSGILGMSDDARFVAYVSKANNISDEDTNTWEDVYRYDRLLGITLLMSVSNTTGLAGDGPAELTAVNNRMVSSDGRYVLFSSRAKDLLGAGQDNNNSVDAYLRDTSGFGTTSRVSLTDADQEIAGESRALGMGADGRRILFYTAVKLDTVNDTNTVADLYVRDRQNGSTKLVSTDLAGKAVGSSSGVIADDGIHIAFVTRVNIDQQLDLNGFDDVYWKDITTNTTKLMSIGVSNIASRSPSFGPAISGNGQRVAFITAADNILPPGQDTNGINDIYVKDVVGNAIFRATTKSTGAQSTTQCTSPSLNGTGDYIAMTCAQGDLDPNDTNGVADVFTKARSGGATTLISRVPNGVLGNASSGTPIISKNGSLIGLSSGAWNFTSPDGNNVNDVFVGSRQ